MRRRVLIVVAVLAFLAVSAGLARWLSTESDERARIAELLDAQAAGNAEEMLALLAPSCRTDRACRATVDGNARSLRRPGEPKILNLQSPTAYALGAARGRTRVAWTVVNRGLPVVQCVTVRRGGSVLAGRRVTLERIGPPIGNESSC